MRCAKENHTTQKIAGGNANTARDLDTKQNSADITQKHKTLDEPPRIERNKKHKATKPLIEPETIQETSEPKIELETQKKTY